MMKRRIKIIFAVLLSFIMTLSTLGGCALFIADEPVSIVSIEKTDTDGIVDTYTITYSDGTTSTFFVTNGVNGENGKDGVDGADGENGKDGLNGVDGKDGKDSNISIEDVYKYYLLLHEGEEKNYEDFLKAFGLVANGEAAAINKTLLSTVKVHSEFIETSDSNEYGQTVISSGAGVIYEINPSTGDSGATDGYTYFLTNYHVIYDEKGYDNNYFPRKIVAYLYGTEYPVHYVTEDEYGRKIAQYGKYGIECEYVGGSAAADVAVIRAKTADVLAINENVQAVTFADQYYVGETAFTVGNPNNEGMSVTQGIVSTDSEYIYLSVDGKSREHRSMRVDVALYPGNSGGGLFNSSGKLIGLSHAGDGDDQNVNYAVPLDLVKVVAEDIMYYHKREEDVAVADKITLGVTVSFEKSKYVYDSATGYGKIVEDLVVTSIIENSIAETLGLNKDDVIKNLCIDRDSTPLEYELSRSYQIGDILFTVRAGDKISFTINRGGNQMQTSEYTVLDSDLKIP